VTGDGIPEILANSVVTNEIKVYIGLKGQRLLEQFGTGNDPPQPDSGRWGKPWATLWMPHRINGNWFEDVRLFDLGDANLDGVGDIYAFSWPYVLEYNGGGKMDSLADALIDITPGTGIGILRRMGNIDASGRDLIAMRTGNEIRFYAPTKDISSVGRPRTLPPGTGPAAVDVSDVGDDVALAFKAMPNPSRGEVRFSWHALTLHGPATIILYDLIGREVAHCDAPAGTGTVLCPVASLPPGAYVAHFRCGDRTASTNLIIQ
jgi:hypothetical protein